MGFLVTSSKPDGDGYHRAYPAQEVKENQITLIKITGERIILTRLGGSLFAFSASCPHAAGDLSKGDLYKGRIDCPDHGYRFDVHTGYPLWPEDEVCRLRHFSIKEKDGQALVKVT